MCSSAQRRAERVENGVAEEDQPPARPQQPVGVRDPDVRVAPDRRAVLREHEVEGLVRQRRVLGARVDRAGTRCRARPGGRARWRAGSRRGRGPPASRRAARTRRTSSRCRSRGRSRRGRWTSGRMFRSASGISQPPHQGVSLAHALRAGSTQLGASSFQDSRFRAACSDSSTRARLTEEAHDVLGVALQHRAIGLGDPRERLELPPRPSASTRSPPLAPSPSRTGGTCRCR